MTFTCGECRVPYESPWALTKHLKVKHNWGQPKEPLYEGLDTLCPQCGASSNVVSAALRESDTQDRALAETIISGCRTCWWQAKILA
jgi:type II secretory ATPase GspE/PulE/Tfp pilus assembly ATPase PilB-like protein